MNWVADNWLVILTAILYVVERVDGISRPLKDRIRTVVEVVNRHHEILTGGGNGVAPSAKEMMPASLNGDYHIDTVLDKHVEPKATPRVTRRRKVGRALLNLLPIASRILDARK